MGLNELIEKLYSNLSDLKEIGLRATYETKSDIKVDIDSIHRWKEGFLSPISAQIEVLDSVREDIPKHISKLKEVANHCIALPRKLDYFPHDWSLLDQKLDAKIKEVFFAAREVDELIEAL